VSLPIDYVNTIFIKATIYSWESFKVVMKKMDHKLHISVTYFGEEKMSILN